MVLGKFHLKQGGVGIAISELGLGWDQFRVRVKCTGNLNPVHTFGTLLCMYGY